MQPNGATDCPGAHWSPDLGPEGDWLGPIPDVFSFQQQWLGHEKVICGHHLQKFLPLWRLSCRCLSSAPVVWNDYYPWSLTNPLKITWILLKKTNNPSVLLTHKPHRSLLWFNCRVQLCFRVITTLIIYVHPFIHGFCRNEHFICARKKSRRYKQTVKGKLPRW